MVATCCAYGCNEKHTKGGPVTFHCFPKDEERRKLWETKIHRENFKATNASRVCSKHFSSDCFDTEKFGGTWLKKTAVPTLFDFPKHLIKKTISRKPLIRKKQEEMNVTTPDPASRKRKFRYIGDFNEDDMNSPSKARKLLFVSQKQSKDLNVKIKNVNKKNQRLEKRVFSLKDMLVALQKKCLVSQPAVNILESMFDGPALDLLLRAYHKKENSKYSPELRSFALTLHFYSKKAYMYVRRIFNTCLPHPATIRKWYQVVDGSPGITKEALEALKCKVAEATEVSKKVCCGLIIDEMAIRRHIEMDNGKLTGYIDYGAGIETNEIPVAREALTFMVNAINDNWKIPVGYFLINGLDSCERANLIKMTLECLSETRVKVVSLTFDGLKCNFKVGHELGANLNSDQLKTAFPHPVTGDDIFIFIDACHSLKLVRNILASKGLIFDQDNKVIDWQYIVKLEKFQQEQGLMAATKIRNQHIQWYREKMKVKLAAQTLSLSVAHALDFLSLDLKLAEFQDSAATVKFVRLFNNLFDSLNSRNLLSRDFKSPIKQSNIKKFLNFYDECEAYIKNLKITRDGVKITESKWKTGFVGFLICIESVRSLFKTLVEPVDSPLSFLMTYKFSQDHLETFFSAIRSRGGYNNNPSAKMFKAAYKQLLVRHEIASSEKANCIPLTHINILNVPSANSAGNKYVKEINHDADRHLCEDLQSVDNSDSVTSDHDYSLPINPKILTQYIDDVTAYISGFVQRKLFSKIKCEECAAALISDRSNSLFQLTNRKNKGGLVQPNKDIYTLCKIAEKSFRKVQSSGKITSRNVMELLIAHSMRDVDANVFKVLNEHILSQNVFNNHSIYLIKSVLFEYFIIRLCHFAKSLNASLQTNKIRSINSKVTIFKGH